MKTYWIVKDANDPRFPYHGPTGWAATRQEALRYPTRERAQRIAGMYGGLVRAVRVVRVTTKWHKRGMSVRDTVHRLCVAVAVLESQVRSLQSAAPKGIPDLGERAKRGAEP